MSDESAARFRAAERALAGELGLDLEERMLQLEGPVGQARVIECGRGAPVLFVHGGGSVASGWLPLWAALRGVRAIAVDRPGCGLSAGFDYRREPLLRTHAVDFLESVLDALGIDAADLVGNSMGALWILWLALDRPARVKRLATVGCPALVVDTSAPFMMRLMANTPLGALLERPATEASSARVMKDLRHDPKAIAARFPSLLAVVTAAANLPGAGASFRSLLGRALTLTGPNRRFALGAEELRRLPARPLVVWGARDPFGNVRSARRFADATGGQLEIVGRGHIPWLDAPDRIAELVSRHLGLTASDKVGAAAAVDRDKEGPQPGAAAV